MEIKKMSIEELKQLLTTIKEEIVSRETKEIIRTTLDPCYASGGRKAWYKLVKNVDDSKTNGYAFEGEFLPFSKEVDLPVGGIIVAGEPHGSVKHPETIFKGYEIFEDGLREFASAKRSEFLTFRDAITSKL